MNAVDDLWDVFLLVQVDKFEPKQVWEFDFLKKAKEDGNVVGMSELEFGIAEDAERTVWIQCLYHFGESDAIPQSFLQLDNGRYWFLDDIFDPFLRFANVTEVFVSLEKLS